VELPAFIQDPSQVSERYDMAIEVRRNAAEALHSMHYEYLGTAWVGVEYEEMTLLFSEPRGRGKSHYRLRIEPASYEHVIQAMLRANPEEAIKAFAAALKDGIPAKEREWSPPEEDANTSAAA
jgi:hypothetical protein